MPTSVSDEERDDGLHDNAINEWYEPEPPALHSHAHRHFGGLEHHTGHADVDEARAVDGHRHAHTHPPDYVHG